MSRIDRVRLLRVQDLEGRGPYRPGRQIAWCDDDHDTRLGHLTLEFGLDHLKQLQRGERAGHGFRSLEQMQRWFTATEQERLAGLDYHLVELDVDRILGESATQVLFVRRRPLRFVLDVLPWPALAREKAA